MGSKHRKKNGGLYIFKFKHQLSVLVVTEQPYKAIVVLNLKKHG
jgi:23S rRNA pseudoU1915 N3-methylase RlmH